MDQQVNDLLQKIQFEMKNSIMIKTDTLTEKEPKEPEER